MRINCFHKIPPILIFALSLQVKICFAQVPTLFEGLVNADNINLRTDATVSSEIICTLNKNERVDVILELYGWLKIRLPKYAPCYVKKNLVECINVTSLQESICRNGKVLKNRVNIRLHPRETSAIVGVVDKNDIINILKEQGDWYRIEPVENCFGWINKIFVNKILKQDNKRR